MSVARAGPDFRDLVFKAIRQFDPGPVLLPSDGVADRLTLHFHYFTDTDFAATSLDVDLQFDGRKYRIEHLLKGGGKHGKKSGKWVRILPRHDLEKRLALLLIGCGINDRLTFALAFMNGAGPSNGYRAGQAIESYLAIVALLNCHHTDRFAG